MQIRSIKYKISVLSWDLISVFNVFVGSISSPTFDTDPDRGKWYRSRSREMIQIRIRNISGSNLPRRRRLLYQRFDKRLHTWRWRFILCSRKSNKKRIHTNSIWHNIENIRYAKTQSLKGKYSPYGTFISGCGSCRICLILLELKKWNRKNFEIKLDSH